MSVTYGMDSALKDDPYLAMGEESLNVASRAGAVGVYLVDVLPLRACPLLSFSRPLTRAVVKWVPAWFPGARFQRDAAAWKAVQLRARDAPHEWAKAQIVCPVFSHPGTPLI